MCIICVDLGRGALTIKEARRALGEMVVKLDKKHVQEIETELAKREAAKPTGRP